MSKKSASTARTPMTTSAAGRIQSAQARAGNGQVTSNSFAARAQRAAANNTPSKKA